MVRVLRMNWRMLLVWFVQLVLPLRWSMVSGCTRAAFTLVTTVELLRWSVTVALCHQPTIYLCFAYVEFLYELLLSYHTKTSCYPAVMIWNYEFFALLGCEPRCSGCWLWCRRWCPLLAHQELMGRRLGWWGLLQDGNGQEHVRWVFHTFLATKEQEEISCFRIWCTSNSDTILTWTLYDAGVATCASYPVVAWCPYELLPSLFGINNACLAWARWWLYRTETRLWIENRERKELAPACTSPPYGCVGRLSVGVPKYSYLCMTFYLWNKIPSNHDGAAWDILS